MKIQYDKDFEKVMNELQANFGWSNIDVLPDSYKDLLNDTIKAVKNCSIPAVVGQSEQLVAFGIWLDKNDKHLENGNITETVQEYLKGN